MHRPVSILVVLELDALRCVCHGGGGHNAGNPSSEIRNKEITENKCRKKTLINGPQVTFLKLKTNINAGKKWEKQGKLE